MGHILLDSNRLRLYNTIIASNHRTESGFNLERASQICGFRLKVADIEASPRVSLLPGEHPWSHPILPEGGELDAFGTGPFDFDDSSGGNTGPIFYIETQPNVTILGLQDVLGEPGYAVREMDGWTSVWTSAPNIHSAMLRQLGQDSGVHLYSETDDLLHAARELLLFQAKSPGQKTLHWPHRFESVTDLYTGETVAESADKWTVNLRANETRFWRVI